MKTEDLLSCITYGETLSDGRTIDLVAPTPDADLKLVVQNGQEYSIVPQIEHNGLVYKPPKLRSSLRKAMRFPAGIREYGGLDTLLLRISPLLTTYCGLPRTLAIVVTFWIVTTWIPECFAAPPVLCVTAVRMAEVIQFFRLLSALCRRAIIVANLSSQLPTEVRPTLLLVDMDSSRNVRGTWRAGNYYGVYMPVAGGGLREVVGSKAVYSENQEAVSDWGEEEFFTVSLPANDLPKVGADLDAIAAEFQPSFELYRLRVMRTNSSPAGNISYSEEFDGPAPIRELYSVLAVEPDMRQLLLPVAEQRLEMTMARSSLDPLAVIVEILWGLVHQVDSITVTDLQKQVNALLRTRGEKLELSAKEIGWRLRSLGFRRYRTASAMTLQFSRGLRGQIHTRAQQLGMKLPRVDGCVDCALLGD